MAASHPSCNARLQAACFEAGVLGVGVWLHAVLQLQRQLGVVNDLLQILGTVLGLVARGVLDDVALEEIKPIRVNAPNSVFALGNVFAKS